MSQRYWPTIPDTTAVHRCQNCAQLWNTEDFHEQGITDLFTRVVAGEIMPSGECPDCHSLCHPITTKEDHA
jgi:hypothetical protein